MHKSPLKTKACAKLVRVDQADMPGIERHRKGKGFAYKAPDGHWLSQRNEHDSAHLARIRALAIPPAYRAVWICPLPNGHLQATARDARGRKQYRYHGVWQQKQGQDKFERMKDFGLALPRLRAQVAHDLAHGRATLPPGRASVLAALVRLLDTTHMRIGNEAYTRANRSYGLSTLRNRHARVKGNQVSLRFRGKSGVWHEVALQDARVARIVERCQHLRGQALFQYVGDDHAVHNLGSVEVNAYIREACGGDFTAKDFRTWHATVHAWALLAPECSDLSNPAEPASTRRVTQALREVASRMGNTLAVCRKSYVHPLVLNCAVSGQWPDTASSADLVPAVTAHGLHVQERALLCALLLADRPE